MVAAVADEEHSSLGVQEALRRLSADAAVVTEPTELELVVAHKGFVWAEIEVTGRSAHGSRPHRGVDAIPPTIGGASYWADAAFIAAAGIPTVLFGPGGEGAHAIEEWVSLSDTQAVARTLLGLATRLCD